MTNPTLFQIDTFSLLFQVFHAIPSMTSPKGLPSNAVFGFTRDLFNILQTQRPTHWLCAMDSPGPGTREALYPKYKANRTETPADLLEQIPYCKQMLEAFRIPVLQFDGFEADDVIGTLTRMALEAGHEVFIVSGDKDFAQLVDEHQHAKHNDECGAVQLWRQHHGHCAEPQRLAGQRVG